ncbi:hypothetical protein ACA350_11540 [Orientia tsutsugamushi]|uniref:hypothetical protein n=1 Tax=Orientia tsutsugamushi TaxID=784 RepID=UPI003529083C
MEAFYESYYKSGDFGIQAKVNSTIRALKPFTENKGINLSCNFKNDIKDLIIRHLSKLVNVVQNYC